MNKVSFFKIASLFIFLLTAQLSFGQDHAEPEFFLENFSGQEGKGVSGDGSDFSGVNWTMDVSDCTLNGGGDYFKVTGNNPRLKARDVDGDAIWYSESVDISCRTDVSFFIYAKLDADMESSDFIKIEYRLDATGSWLQATTNGYLPGNGAGNYYDVEQFGLSGTSLQLKVTINVNDSEEIPWVDNMKVYGTGILFYEDQADASQTGSTITGSGTSVTNASGITWTMNRPNSKVETHINNNPHIHCERLNGDTVTWETGDIIISGYTNLNFTVFARKIQSFDSSDYIKLQYSIDGGTRINIATYNTNLTGTNIGGDINSLTSTTVVGDILKIYIEVYQNGNEKFHWEDITLTGIPFYNVWQGTESDLVTNTAKWSKSSQPTAASNVWIPNTKHLKLTDDQAYNTVNARSTSQLTIEKTGSLTTVSDFTKIAGTGAVTLNSDSNEFASIIVKGTATGNIKYNRFVNYQAYQEWDIIGPPVLNQNMLSFAQTNTNNSNANNTGSLAFDDPYYALGRYLTEWGSWSNYTTSTIPNANFPAAKGYQMATNAVNPSGSIQGQALTFTGEIATTSQSINIQNQNGTNNGNGRRWNLVANPFPSYLNGNTNAGNTNGGANFIDVNANVMDLEYTGLYYWKADGTGYGEFNQIQTNSDDATLFVAPGQGFFVAARNSEIAQIRFTPQMRTVTGGDDFISGAPMLLNYKLDLKLYNGAAQRAETKFHFQQGLTLGLDPGYDAGAFDQASALSARLPEDDQGTNFQLSAMNIEAAYNQTIPLVINQEQGQNFRVSISNNTLPDDINVYLEDALNGTLTSLKDQDFELVAQENLSDDGRFYIRFTTQILAINDVLSPSNITVFKLNTDNFITIKGLSPEMGKTTATLYNMLGMKVRTKALDSSQSAQQISTQGLASGVYIINLKAGEQAVSKKVIIQ